MTYYIYRYKYDSRIYTPTPPLDALLSPHLTFRRDFLFFIFVFHICIGNLSSVCKHIYYQTFILSDDSIIFAEKIKVMDAVAQEMFDTYKNNVIESWRGVISNNFNEAEFVNAFDDWVHRWKMDDISTLSSAEFRQQYQSRFTVKEFELLFWQCSDACLLFRWFSTGFFRQYFSASFLNQVGIYIDSNFNGALPPMLSLRNDTYRESRYPEDLLCSSCQHYLILGTSNMSISLSAHHNPTITVRDDSELTLLNTAERAGARIELTDSASVTIKPGCQNVVIIKHDSTVTINDETREATIINNPITMGSPTIVEYPTLNIRTKRLLNLMKNGLMAWEPIYV